MLGLRLLRAECSSLVFSQNTPSLLCRARPNFSLLYSASAIVRFASNSQNSRSHTNRPNQRPEGKEIVQLVPKSGLINLIDGNGAFRRQVSLSSSLANLKGHEKLIVVRLEKKTEEDEDPTVHCKIISTRPHKNTDATVTRNSTNSDNTSSSDRKEKQKKEKQKKEKATVLKTKSVTLGWTIAPNDLLMQKKSSVESWLQKGHPIQIFLGKSAKRQQRTANSALDLEKRKILLKTCRSLCEQAGAIEQSIEGDVNSNVVILNYLPPPQRQLEEES